MSLENVPICGGSVRFIEFWALIGDFHWRRIVAVLPTMIMNIGQFVDIFVTTESIDAVIQDAYFVVLWFNTLVRTMLLIYNSRRYVAFLKDIAAAYREIERIADEEVNRMLAATTKSANGLAKANFYVGIVAMVFLLYPLFTPNRRLPYGAHIPGVNKYESPWYEILFTFQFLVTIPGCCMYLPFTTLVVSFILFSILMNKVLQHQLINLKNKQPKDVWPEVVWCIQYQMQIIRYVDIINQLTTYIFLTEFITFGALLCALMFLLNIISDLGQMVIVAGYVIMIMGQIAAMYWYANELYHQSGEVAVQAYSTNWFDFDVKTQKAILMLIVRAQKPCTILVGNVYPMTLEMFQSLLNATYSGFTLLNRFYD